MKRIATPELLDSNCGTPAEVAVSLSDLRRINRWFGGVSTTSSLIAEVARKSRASSLSLLEVASGSGFVPEAASHFLQRAGIRLAITLLDRQVSHMNGGNGRPAIAGDALALPFRERSFDLVSCCLFAHHLSPVDLVRFINEALRVCRSAVVINDVIRHPVHVALVYASLPLYRSRITYHDAPASVRQAYTVEEMREILSRTDAARVEVGRHFLFRMGIILWKE